MFGADSRRPAWAGLVAMVGVVACACGGGPAPRKPATVAPPTRSATNAAAGGGHSPAKPAVGGRVFTIAGTASATVRLPFACASATTCRPGWSATDRRISGPCLSHLADGTIVLCSTHALLLLGRDGRVRPMDLHGVHGVLEAADVAADGSIVLAAYDDTASRALAVWRVLRGRPPVLVGRTDLDSASGIAALRGGAVAVADAPQHTVVEMTRGAAVRRVAGEAPADDPDATGGFAGDGGPATDALLDAPSDVSAAADGSILIADSGNGRVRRVGADGRITTVAGGGSGWREGAPATRSDIGRVRAVAAETDGAFVLAGDDGVRRVGRDGTIHTVVHGTASRPSGATDPRALDDGAPTARALVAGAMGVDVLPDAGVLVLTSPERSPEDDLEPLAPDDPAFRLLLAGGARRDGRLAVALPGLDRRLAAMRRLVIVATAPDRARIEVRRSGRLLLSRRRRLHRGVNRLRLAIPATDAVVVVAVTARAAGAVASARLTVIPTHHLSRRTARRALDGPIESAVSTTVGDADVAIRRCRPRSGGYRCALVISTLEKNGEEVDRVRVRLRRDGLIGYRQGGARRERLFEPPAR